MIKPVRHRSATTVIALVLLAACEAGRVEPGGEEQVGAQVGEMLYRDGLMAVPEVNARMREAVLAIDRDGLPADSVLGGLHDWLVAWSTEHPDRIAHARSSRPPGEPGIPRSLADAPPADRSRATVP
jgi:hypothetical protein